MGRRASLSSPGTFVPASHTTMPGMATLAALRASFSPGASYRTYKEVAGGNQRGEKVEVHDYGRQCVGDGGRECRVRHVTHHRHHYPIIPPDPSPIHFFFFLMFIYFERHGVCMGEGQREGDTESKAGSRL